MSNERIMYTNSVQDYLKNLYITEQVENYAEKFLFDSLEIYKDLDLSELNCRFTYIADTIYYDTKGIGELKNFLFLKVDINGHIEVDKKNETFKYKEKDFKITVVKFKKVMDKIRLHSSFIYDYAELENDQPNNFHIIILELPKSDLMSKMLKGKFSEMYTPDEVKLFSEETQDIFLKKESIKEGFKQAMSIKFGVSPEFINTDKELYPIMLEQDFKECILNWYDGFKEVVNFKI